MEPFFRANLQLQFGLEYSTNSSSSKFIAKCSNERFHGTITVIYALLYAIASGGTALLTTLDGIHCLLTKDF